MRVWLRCEYACECEYGGVLELVHAVISSSVLVGSFVFSCTDADTDIVCAIKCVKKGIIVLDEMPAGGEM
jgi:hypothetical protein